MAVDQRKHSPLHVHLTNHTHDRIRDLASLHGVTVSALVQSILEDLELPPSIVDRARAIMVQRTKRS